MEQLTVAEYNQLLSYYKNKVLELEFNYLLLQIESKRSIDKKNKDLDDENFIKELTPIHKTEAELLLEYEKNKQLMESMVAMKSINPEGFISNDDCNEKSKKPTKKHSST